jgi:hypothetical protein
MKPHSGVKPAASSTPSRHWIGANRKNEPSAVSFEAKVVAQEVDGSEIAYAPTGRLALFSEVKACRKNGQSSPMLAIRSETSRAHSLVVRLRRVPQLLPPV